MCCTVCIWTLIACGQLCRVILLRAAMRKMTLPAALLLALGQAGSASGGRILFDDTLSMHGPPTSSGSIGSSRGGAGNGGVATDSQHRIIWNAANADTQLRELKQSVSDEAGVEGGGSVITAVATAEELQAAVQAGAAHIELREHMSLASVPSEGLGPILGSLASTTKSIRVRGNQ